MPATGSRDKKGKGAIVLAALLSMASVGSLASFASVTPLYLEGDGVPVGSLGAESPQISVLPNHDPWRDTAPGLVVGRGGLGVTESDPDKFQQWVGAPDGMDLDGAFAFIFSAAMKDFQTGARGIVEAFLLDCDPAGMNCIQLAQSHRDIVDWSGGWGSWGEHSIEFGRILHTVPPGRSLSVKITVAGDSDDDMWFAYGSQGFESMVTSTAHSDIVIDCSFTEWLDGDSSQLEIPDQGGADDWSSPANLDVTLLSVSSNLVDSFHVLMGIDDIAPQSVDLAALVDTDQDGAVDYVLAANLDGARTTVELYSCDDSLTDDCGGALLERTYSPDSFCAGTGAGPWGQDTFLEIAVPFSDLLVEDATVIFGSLISYAGASLLASPKDSVLGVVGEDYSSGIHYNTETGDSGIVAQLGSDFLVRRDTDPSAVRASSPVATITSGPFDDSAGILLDGQTWFYVVEREGGLPVEISVHPNPAAGTVRLGFNDVDDLSALVDPALSSVSVSTPSVPADGTSRASVTIIPRDDGGVPLGGGCAIGVDQVQLSPGTQVGPVHDNYDGSYTFEITATGPGTAQVAVEVEGIFLTATPQIVFY